MRTSSLKKALSEIQGAIFDMDGTLIDSMGIWKQIDEDFLTKRGMDPDPVYTESLNGMNYSQAALFTITYLGLQTTPEALMEEWDAMAQEAYAERIPAKEGARELLVRLHERPIPLALATVSGRRLYEPCLKRLQMYDYFDCMIGDQTGKDSPALFLQAAGAIGVRPGDCLVFEDSLTAIRYAKEAGFLTCGVYDDAARKNWQELKDTADYHVLSFRSLY